MKKFLFAAALLLSTSSFVHAMDQATTPSDEGNDLRKSGMFIRAEQTADVRESEHSTEPYSAWKDINKTKEKVQELQVRVARMKDMDISPEDHAQLKQDAQALSFSPELQNIISTAIACHSCLHNISNAIPQLAVTGLYTPEQLQALGSVPSLAQTTCQFLSEYSSVHNNIHAIKETLFPQPKQQFGFLDLISLMSSPEFTQKFNEEMEYQKQGGEPRPIVINLEDIRGGEQSSDSEESSDGKGDEGEQQ